MYKKMYEITDNTGELMIEELCETLGDMVIRAHFLKQDAILEVSDEGSPRLFNCLWHLMGYHREIERQYFKISDSTAPADRDQMTRDDLEALGDKMDDIIKSIKALIM